MLIQPRHAKLIEFLTEQAPKAYPLDFIAHRLKLSMPVMRNEAPRLVEAGLIKRRAVGKTYEYFATKETKHETSKVEPLSKADIGELLDAITSLDYQPALTKLDWTMPFALTVLVTGDLDRKHTARESLEGFLEALERTQQTCRRLLSTTKLWDDRGLQWLTDGLTENKLELFQELTSQASRAHGRLDSSNQDLESD